MPVVQFVSPNITLEEWQDGRKSDIDVFEDQLQGWVFDQAQGLAASEHSAHALLALTAPYFEMITCYLEGVRTPSRQATEFLRRGLKTVLGASASAEAIALYVSEVRNGIAHELMFRTVVLHKGAPGLPRFDIDKALNVLVVDPFWLLGLVHQHFRNYVVQLRSPTTEEDRAVVAKFNAFMNIKKAPQVAQAPSSLKRPQPTAPRRRRRKRRNH